MFQGIRTRIKQVLFVLLLLVLLSPLVAGHLTAEVLHHLSIFVHSANLHGPHVTPPKVQP